MGQINGLGPEASHKFGRFWNDWCTSSIDESENGSNLEASHTSSNN